MSPPRQVGAGFPIWLPRPGAGSVPGAGAALSPGRRGGEKGSRAAASLPHAAPPGRPGLSPALAPAAAAEPRCALSRCSPSPCRNPRVAPARQGRHAPAPSSSPAVLPEGSVTASGVRPPSAARSRPVALLLFSVGKPRHGAAAAAEAAASSPSRAPSAGPRCLSFPGEVSFLHRAACSETTAGFPPACYVQV